MVVKKNNGAAENFVEGNPFNEGRATSVTVTEVDKTVSEKEQIVDRMTKTTNISEAEARGMMGLSAKKPGEYDKLTATQKKDFDFARAIGINESDAFKLVRIASR